MDGIIMVQLFHSFLNLIKYTLLGNVLSSFLSSFLSV